MAIVVSDTSPIRALAHLNLISLLGDLFGTVVIPPAVDQELKTPPADLPVVDVGGIAFISVIPVVDSAKVTELLRELDPGESEAIALAVERGIKAILIDEAEGRAVATRHGLLPIGVLGVLVRAKQRGRIERVMPLLDRLEGEIDFFISAALRDTILQMAGES